MSFLASQFNKTFIDSATEETTLEKVQKMKKYTEIENVEINADLINKLIRMEKTSVYFAKKTEGFLFGRESLDSVKIFVTSLIPCSLNESNSENINEYLENKRLDNVNVGYFFSGEQNELSQLRLRTLIEFQRNFPNAVFLFFDRLPSRHQFRSVTTKRFSKMQRQEQIE